MVLLIYTCGATEELQEVENEVSMLERILIIFSFGVHFIKPYYYMLKKCWAVCISFWRWTEVALL